MSPSHPQPNLPISPLPLLPLPPKFSVKLFGIFTYVCFSRVVYHFPHILKGFCDPQEWTSCFFEGPLRAIRSGNSCAN